MKSVIVVGAGASGLAAGIAAARGGAEVTVLEAQERPGRKLLVTGNGRCNLTNLEPGLSKHYYGSGAKLAEKLLTVYDAEWTLHFFRGLGLLTRDRDGYVYPYSNQASSVLSVLLLELRRLGGKLKLGGRVRQIIDCGEKDGSAPTAPETASSCRRFAVVTDTWTYRADQVIFACGSCASPSTGAGPDGYRLAAALGHRVTKLRPALSPLRCPGGVPPQAAGVRCRAKVSLPACGKSETGELQWTKQGVSGIVIFQLSGFLTSEVQTLAVDFLPDYESAGLAGLLQERASALGREPVSALLRGLLNEKLIPVIMKKTGEVWKSEAAEIPGNMRKPESTKDRENHGSSFPGTCSELTQSHIRALCQSIKDFRLSVTGPGSYDQAQICAGGVDGRELTEHLESRLHSGLYICGELVDVDGPCGGYNLQWAFASGYEAGRSAAAD